MGLMSSKEQRAHLYPFFFTNALRFKTYKSGKVTSRTSVIRHWMFRLTIRKRVTTSQNRLLNGSASGGNILWKNLGGSRLEECTLGTIVNGEPIGNHFRGDDAVLRAGENEVIAGGVDSPFVFSVFIA
jgi:hypothetical protein